MRGACHKEFQKGKRERASAPLSSGIYKLKEARGRFINSLGLVDEVRAFIDVKCASASPRAPQYAGSALRRLPKEIAYDLGRNVLPAVEALAGDYVPHILVDTLARDARIEANTLVIQCDELDDEFRCRGIGSELVRIRYDLSVLERLIIDAVDLIDTALRKCEPYLRAEMLSSWGR